jgi:hypothetical protein
MSGRSYVIVFGLACAALMPRVGAAAPVLEVLEVKDTRAKERATAGELQSLTRYIAARMAIRGSYAVRASAQLRAALASARKEAAARCDSPPCAPPQDPVPEQVLEVKIGSFGKGCAITANLIELASLNSIAAATERFECDDALEEAIDRAIGRLVNDESPEPVASASDKAPPKDPKLASLRDRLKQLKTLDAEAANRLFPIYSEAISLDNPDALRRLSDKVDEALEKAQHFRDPGSR